MKRLFLLGACMALVAACSDKVATDHTPKLKYTYAVIEPTPIDATNMAYMGVVSDPGKHVGGVVSVYPASQHGVIDAKPHYLIEGRDGDSNGVWDTVTVCGYLKRTDGKPSSCGTFSRGLIGWNLDKFPPTDMGHISGPSKGQIDAWVATLDRSRARLLEKAATRSA